VEHDALRLRRVSENDHGISLGNLDALTPIAEPGDAKGRLRFPPDLDR
jgi:hypothetical protein